MFTPFAVLYEKSPYLYSFLDIGFRIFYIIAISDTIIKREGGFWAKFVVRKPEKEIISMRIASDTLQILDTKAAEAEISRNELINQMILFALANMDETPKE